MLKKMKSIVGFVLLAIITQNVDAQTPSSASRIEDGASYVLGRTIGRMITNTGVSFDQVNKTDFWRGIEDALSGAPIPLSEKDTQSAYQTLRQRGEANQERESKKAKEIAVNYMKKNGENPRVSTLQKGVQREVLEAGSGGSAKPGQRITYTWESRRTDGTMIDSSDVRGQKSFIDVGGTTSTDGPSLIAMMPRGSKWRITIPPELGYGEFGMPPLVKPNEVIVVDVTVVDITDSPKTSK